MEERMKLVLASDNHRDLESLQWIVSRHPDADRFLHLGDSEQSEETLADLGFVGVRGNYPFEPKFPMDRMMSFQGVRTLLTHGHKYSVKMGLYALVEAALSMGAKMVFFGHTHDPVIRTHENILFVNPGSCASSRSGAQTYAVVHVELPRIRVRIAKIGTDETLAEFEHIVA
jgi:putative phosphoesterase